MLNNGNDESSEKSKKKEAKRVSRKASKDVRRAKRGLVKRTAPDDSTAYTKHDRKNRTKKIVYRNEAGKKTGVDRFTKTERQAESQKNSGKYTEEDAPITYKNKKKKAAAKGAKAAAKQKKVSRGLTELSSEDPYSKTMKEKK